MIARFYAVWILPTLWVPLWVWLYAGSGFILKAARRFDFGLHWFNRNFDIENKPLSAIGIVAGAMIAELYLSVAWVILITLNWPTLIISSGP